MDSFRLPSNCTASALPFPTIFGAEFLSVEARMVYNYTRSVPSQYNFNHNDIQGVNMSFCNVTLTHTHPGQNDTQITQVWLPVQPEWNERMQAVGGGGWIPGLHPFTDISMAGAIAQGYATLTSNGGVPSIDPKDWALLSPGNVNLYRLQNFASVSLSDAALTAKSVISSFYGQRPKFSYWSGCSQGGRQGLMLAQRYPDLYDGIAAAAPAINWAEFATSAQFPQQVMRELGRSPHPCELDALTTAAISACDSNDGVQDGIISDPDSCTFSPYTMINKPINCTTPSAPKSISPVAAAVADAVWNGARGKNGTFLWYTTGHEANMTAATSISSTVCSINGTCTAGNLDLLTDWTRLFIKKDPDFDIATITRDEFELDFRNSVRDYTSIIGTNYADLSEFRKAGGKLITYHGLADEIIPFRNTRHYYNAVTALDPKVHDFYRFFEAPGLAHCNGGIGGYPGGTFDALVKWVEGGVVPEVLEARSVLNRTSILCPYPKKAIFKGEGANYGAEDFVCE